MKDIEKYLIHNGVQFVFGKKWSPDIASDILVIATSACDATSILQKLDDSSALENAALLNKVVMEPLISATCFFEKAPTQYQGFGILFPRGQGVRPLGVLMNDLIFNRPAKAHSETWILGGALDRQIIDLPDAEIINLVEKTHGLVFDETQKVLEYQITRWPRALPHYTIEHNEIITQLKPMKKVFLHGNYLGQLGLSRLLEKSEQLAEVIAKDVV